MRKSNQGCANGRKKGRKEPAPLTFSFFSPLPGPSSAIIKRRRSNSKRNNACESAPHFSQDANRACVPRVFLSFPLEHKLWIMFFFKLRLIIAEIEEIGGLMSLWELTFFCFFPCEWNYLEIITLLMKLCGTVSPWKLWVSRDIRRSRLCRSGIFMFSRIVDIRNYWR